MNLLVYKKKFLCVIAVGIILCEACCVGMELKDLIMDFIPKICIVDKQIIVT